MDAWTTGFEPSPAGICFISWGTVGRIGLDIGTAGGYEAGKYAYDKTYGKAGDEQKAGYNAAGQASSDLGKQQRDWYQQQGQQALGYFSGANDTIGTPTGGRTAGWHGSTMPTMTLSHNPNAPISPDQALINEANNRPGQQQQYFQYMQGQAGQQTNQEQLYNERKNGNDPAAAYQDSRAIASINNQLAARGRYNSGPGVRQISDYEANANAQRSQQLAGLAGGADSSRLGVDSAYGSAASGASGEQSKYFGDLTTNSTNLAQAKADTFGHYSDQAGNAYSQGQLAQIEAQLAASGVDAATMHQFMSDMGAVAGGAGNIISAGSKKPPAGAPPAAPAA